MSVIIDGNGPISGAIASNSTLLGSVSPTSGQTATLSGLNLTGYKQVFIVLNNLVNSNSTLYLTSATTSSFALSSGSQTTFHGFINIDLTTGLALGNVAGSLGAGGANSSVSSVIASGYSTSTTAITLGLAATKAFTSGTINFYGIA